MQKYKEEISRRTFLKAVSGIGISAASTLPFHDEAHAAPDNAVKVSSARHPGKKPLILWVRS
jgi:hypothetical protein